MNSRVELAVLGAGPAGVAAALAASECNVSVLILDRSASAGGQVYRRLTGPLGAQQLKKWPDEVKGDRLREQLRSSAVSCRFERAVWSVERGFRIDTVGPAGVETWEAERLLVASGTTERVIPFPGWTLPGVMGLAAATALLKSQRVLPGQRPVVAGSGPLLWAVASGIVAGGGMPAAVIDLADTRRWVSSLPALFSRPTDLLKGLGWMHSIRRQQVPVISSAAVRKVWREGTSLVVEVVERNRDGTLHREGQERRLSADALCIGHGLLPATEVTRLLGADHVFDAQAGGWKPVIDDQQRTSIPGLFAAGDCTGITGAEAAQLEGRLAGLTVAHEAGRITDKLYRMKAQSLRRHNLRVSRVGASMAALMMPAESFIDDIPGDTVVCRCEDVTCAEVQAALAAGATGLNQIKSWTRCGMGPCQGRVCGDTVAAIASRHLGGRTAVGAWSPRVPLVPLPMDDFVGAFTYHDIAIPKAAPL
ncbi:MAG: NAD(P)/FAD-dependent oxidoreductase [Arenicellales bacterium]|nr:NAD(P)/FAD-dependent oxidoreductase [Arenicellales bacterium]